MKKYKINVSMKKNSSNKHKIAIIAMLKNILLNLL